MKKIRQGFTLIELMIVLAIAGLIISLVFVAASAAQRNGRDTTRRTDTQKISTAFEQFASNNNGRLPKDNADVVTLVSGGYVDTAKLKDPSSGVPYFPNALAYQTTPLSAPCTPGTLGYIVDQKDPAQPTTYYLQMCLESGIFTFRP